MSNEELVAEIQAGSVELMGDLWEQVAGLIRWKAQMRMSDFENCGVELEDLCQSGYLAMVAAVNTYDPAAGGAFSTWLMYHLKNSFAEAAGCRTQKGRKEPLNNFISLDTPLKDDADSGTGLGAFQHTGMSIQDRYLMIEEERKERESRRHQKARENEIRSKVKAMTERVLQEAETRVANMTPEEKEHLLKLYGYV